MHQQFKHTPPPSCHFRVHPRALSALRLFYGLMTRHSVFVIEYSSVADTICTPTHTRVRLKGELEKVLRLAGSYFLIDGRRAGASHGMGHFDVRWPMA
jgi:hypothetical protein